MDRTRESETGIDVKDTSLRIPFTNLIRHCKSDNVSNSFIRTSDTASLTLILVEWGDEGHWVDSAQKQENIKFYAGNK